MVIIYFNESTFHCHRHTYVNHWPRCLENLCFLIDLIWHDQNSSFVVGTLTSVKTRKWKTHPGYDDVTHRVQVRSAYSSWEINWTTQPSSKNVKKPNRHLFSAWCLCITIYFFSGQIHLFFHYLRMQTWELSADCSLLFQFQSHYGTHDDGLILHF